MGSAIKPKMASADIKRTMPLIEDFVMKQTAVIEDWIKVEHCLIGKVCNHPRQTEFCCDMQRTSTLIKFDPDNRIAETVNMIYTLGTPRQTSLR